MKKHVTIRVYGKVQGVFFRQTSMEKAQEHGLTGFAQNEPDGSVYIEAEGDETRLTSFITWCQSGPPAAKVTKVTAEEDELKGYEKFEVRR